MLRNEVQQEGKYRISGNSSYFLRKYGTVNPEIEIVGTDLETIGDPWNRAGCMAARIFRERVSREQIPVLPGGVFYGHIVVEEATGLALGELVTAGELEGVPCL
jgi:hypothetical protein